MALNYFYNELTHGAIQNLETLDFYQFLMNPTELQVAIGVNYEKNAARGGSRERLNYKNTANATIPLTLVFPRSVFFDLERRGDTLSKQEIADLKKEYLAIQNQLLEFCYPVGRANDPLRRSPPAALLLWPGVLGMRLRVTNLTIRNQTFDTDMKPTLFTATIQFEEARLFRLTSSQARQKGFIQYQAQHGKGNA